MVNATDPRLAAYLEAVKKAAATQDLTQDERETTRDLSIIFTGVASAFVALRFAARYKQSASYGLDDLLIVVALLFMVGNLACVIVMTHNGLGLHSGALSLSNAEMLGKILLINEPLYVTAISLVKISLLLMYYRIFPLRSMRIGAIILGSISIAWTTCLIILAETQCIPIRKSWQPWIRGHCIDLKITFLTISVPSILTDIAILAMPLPHVWRLQTNLTQKVSLTFIFGLGSFVVFTSVYRLTVFMSYDPKDVPYTLAPGCAWNNIEIGSAIISASLPTLGPLLRKFISGLKMASSKTPTRSIDTSLGLQTMGGGGPSHRSKHARSKDFFKLADQAKYGLSNLSSPGRNDDARNQVIITATDMPPKRSFSRSRSMSRNRRQQSEERPLTNIHLEQEVVWSEQWIGDKQTSG